MATKTQTGTIEGLKRQIKKVLSDYGGYDDTLGLQIELVATDILVYRKLRIALLDPEINLVNVELSREGDERLRVNPLVFELREQSKTVQKGLDSLTMNIKSKKEREVVEDTFNKFMEELNKDD